MNTIPSNNASLGQIWTPDEIADKMVEKMFSLLPHKSKLRILDPAVGPATFPRALEKYKNVCSSDLCVTMYDVDERMVNYTKQFFLNNKGWEALQQDYLQSPVTVGYDAIIMNPPYIRQELIPQEQKKIYYNFLESAFRTKINKRSNYYVLFLLKALLDLKPGGALCAIVYDAISSSQYGKDALNLMLKMGEPIDEEYIQAPFGDALIDAKIIYWQKRKKLVATQHHKPTTETISDKISLYQLMSITRGTALPHRKIYVISPKHPLADMASPILIKQKNPNLFICTCFDLALLNTEKAAIVTYLKKQFLENELAFKNDPIKPVNGQICFNYYLRDKPRHLLNLSSNPISDNFYVSQVLHNFPFKVAWLLLNSDLFLNSILANGRNQGNGLLKLQAYEYKNSCVPNWLKLKPNTIKQLEKEADSLIADQLAYADFRLYASKIAKEVF